MTLKNLNLPLSGLSRIFTSYEYSFIKFRIARYSTQKHMTWKAYDDMMILDYYKIWCVRFVYVLLKSRLEIKEEEEHRRVK